MEIHNDMESHSDMEIQNSTNRMTWKYAKKYELQKKERTQSHTDYRITYKIHRVEKYIRKT